MSTTKSDEPEWKGSESTEWVGDGVTYLDGEGEAVQRLVIHDEDIVTLQVVPSEVPPSSSDTLMLTGAPLSRESFASAYESLKDYISRGVHRLVPQSATSLLSAQGAKYWHDTWFSGSASPIPPRPLTATEQRLLAEYHRMGEFLMLFITAGPAEPQAAMPYIRAAAHAWTEMDLDRTDFNHRGGDPDRVAQARGHVLNTFSTVLRLAWCVYPQYPDTYCIPQSAILQTAQELIVTTEIDVRWVNTQVYSEPGTDGIGEVVDVVQDVLANTDLDKVMQPVGDADLLDDARVTVRLWVWLCEQDDIPVMLGDRLAEEFGIELPPLA